MSGFLSSDRGQKSFSRLSAAFLLLNLCAWEWIVVVKTSKITAAEAIIGLIGVLYGVNKLAENFGKGGEKDG